jgi:SPP1 family predicted phage head-tail adaptor
VGNIHGDGMRAGTLDERITWQEATFVQDEYGEPIPTWADWASCWANVQSRAAGERFLSGGEQVMAAVSHTVRVRYRTDLTVQMRGVWRTDRYLYIENIIDPDGRKSDLVLMCREEQY